MAVHKTCPIIGRCLALALHHLPVIVSDTIHEVDYLKSLSENLLSELGYIRLRGFLIIEEMLYEVGRHYKMVQTPLDANIDFRLESRSWQGLCGSVKKLTHLMDEMNLYVAEAQLKAGPHPWDLDEQSRYCDHMMMLSIAGKARSGIVLFRPYLKNENVSVSRLPDRLVSIYDESYGYTYHSRFLCLIRSLMDVKL